MTNYGWGYLRSRESRSSRRRFCRVLLLVFVGFIIGSCVGLSLSGVQFHFSGVFE